MTKKTIDEDIRERVETASRSIMDDHPEVEAVVTMFLSKHLENVLAGLIVGAEGSKLKPEQNFRLFEVWVRVGAQLLYNQQRGILELDQRFAACARRLADAQAETAKLQPQPTPGPAQENGE